MRILVTWASKHGSTADIARAIGSTLREHGATVALAPIEQADMDAQYDAYIIGSAVYMGRWMKPALQFTRDHRARFITAPVWLFSSGPLGRPAQPGDATVNLPELLANTAPHEHKIFAGKLDKSQLSFAERAVVRVVRAPYGDFRDWDEISQWAHDIAKALQPKEVHA
jgi:menaquinone-dependent protoporphyrinogen oxidase